MARLSAVVILVACAVLGTGCDDTPTAPSTTGPVTIDFARLRDNGAAVTTYSEGDFEVTIALGKWSLRSDYGNPAPFIEFWAGPGETVKGDVAIMAARARFTFKSVDLYSSTTPIPYTITGVRDAALVFQLQDTLPNTFGNFRTVINPEPTVPIDMLIISLSNAAFPCCRNPMGIDTIILN